MVLNALGIASVVFLILYAILFVALAYGFSTAQLKFKSRWSLVLFHVALRLAAQSVGIAFAVVGYANTSLLITYLVLGAEGFFSLVLCTARFLVSFHNHAFGDSWLEPKAHHKLPLAQRLSSNFILSRRVRRRLHGRGKGGGESNDETTAEPQTNWMAFVHWLLIGGNTIIITGGSILGGSVDSSTDGAITDPASYNTGKAMRGAGQGIFLAIMVALLGAIIGTVYQYRARAAKRGHRTPGYGHVFLLILLVISPFLLVRGVFGVLQAVVDSLSYYSPSTYEADGLSTEFVIKEAVLSIAMEWVTCALLILTWPAIKVYGWHADRTSSDPLAEQKEHQASSSDA